MLHKWPFLIIVFLLLGGTPYVSAFAQEAFGIKIQPAIIEERVDPGAVLSFTLRASTTGKETGTFHIVKRNIKGLTERGTPIFADDEKETEFEVSSWIKINQDPVTVSPGKVTEIPFSIEVPQNASPGGHFGAIFLSTEPVRPKETGVGVGFQVGTIINLRIAGEVIEEAELREFRTDRLIYGKPEVKFSAKVENLGNVLARPRGPLEIFDFWGKKVATLTMNDEAAGVFPQASRSFETAWSGEGFAFGRYQVVLGLVYGEEARKTLSESLSFWILPQNIIFPVVGGILALTLILVFSIKIYVRRKIRSVVQASGAVVGASAVMLPRGRRGRRQKDPFSRLAVIAIVLLGFTLIFFMLLLFFLA